MNRLVPALALAVLLAPAARAGEMLQADPQSFPIEGAKRVRIEFPVGKLALEGDDGTTVRVLVRVDCKRLGRDDCADEARRIRVEHDVQGGTFRLEFTGIRKNNTRVNVEARVLVPRALAAQAHMGVGKADVRAMTGDVDFELGVGELELRGEERHYRDAEVESGVGDVSLDTRTGHVRDSGFIGRSARWSDGRGPGFVRAHVGVGHASVSLD